MSLAEIACRSRQGVWKRAERTGLGRRGERLTRPVLDGFAARGPGRFFAGATEETTPQLLSARMPESCLRVLASADAACQGRFDLLGYRALSFGEPVDWHLDPIAKVHAPLTHWSRVPTLDRTVVGDSKVVWELNRHQWLVTLGQAYRLTGNDAYTDAVARVFAEWSRANPRGQGVNWASSLEVALRPIAWCWALFLVRGSPRMSGDLVAGMVHSIEAHAAHVERYLSHYCSPNTHLTGEALGLLYAGVIFPEFRRARQWRRQGMRILSEQIDRHISADGVYFEQSTCYQRYTAEIYLHAMILGARVGLALPPTATRRVRSLLDFLLWVRNPDGSMPMIGDADGGWLLPLVPRAPDDLRGVFSTAAAWFGRHDYAWAAGDGPAPETLWLLGQRGLEMFETLAAAPPHRTPSRAFAAGGYVVMRNSWRTDAHQLVFDVGPVGAFGHGHADLLSIHCAPFGTPSIVDAGTFCYTAHPSWRDFFRTTAAHSTVTVDRVSQSVPSGPFGWAARPSARLRRWQSTEAFDLADAEHAAYHRLKDPVVHRRRVLFVKPRYWLIVDDLEGATEHRLDLRFQFAPTDVTLDPEHWVRVRGREHRGLLVRAFAGAPLQAEVHEGELDPPAGWASFDYGHREPAPALSYSIVTRLPFRIMTLLLPVADIGAPSPRVSLLRDGHSNPTGLVFEEVGERVRLDDDGRISVRRGATVDEDAGSTLPRATQTERGH